VNNDEDVILLVEFLSRYIFSSGISVSYIKYACKKTVYWDKMYVKGDGFWDALGYSGCLGWQREVNWGWYRGLLVQLDSCPSF